MNYQLSIEEIARVLDQKRGGFMFRICFRQDGKIKTYSGSNSFSAHLRARKSKPTCTHVFITKTNFNTVLDLLEDLGILNNGVIKTCSIRTDRFQKHKYPSEIKKNQTFMNATSSRLCETQDVTKEIITEVPPIKIRSDYSQNYVNQIKEPVDEDWLKDFNEPEKNENN